MIGVLVLLKFRGYRVHKYLPLKSVVGGECKNLYQGARVSDLCLSAIECICHFIHIYMVDLGQPSNSILLPTNHHFITVRLPL